VAVSSPITVVIVDDHEIVRRGLVDLLTLDDAFEVVGEAATGAEALQVVRATRPRVVLLDVRLPDRSGVSVCRTLGRGPQPPAVLMLTSFSDADAAAASAEAGAAGYLLKDVHGDALLDALRRVSAGEVLAPGPTAAGAGGDHHAAPLPQVDDAGWQLLTGQERRVLLGIGEGRTNKQIAAELYLSERTVEHYEASMLAKLGLRRRTQAVAYVTRLGPRVR